jgi:hypothetical protein
MTERERDETGTAAPSDDDREHLTVSMAKLLTPHAPSESLHQRLMESVGSAPLRYAPFFGRLAQLFEITENHVEAELARLADPRCWRWTGLPGVSVATVTAAAHLQASEATWVRFAPGTRFPHHSHTGEERVLVLEGSYIDDGGLEHGPGDLHRMPRGSRHSFVVSRQSPCIAAARIDAPLVFSAWPLRVLAKLMGR